MGQHLDQAVDRTFGRVGKVLDAIEADPDGEAVDNAVKEMDKAQPWDLANLGQALVQDTVAAERDNDDNAFNQ